MNNKGSITIESLIVFPLVFTLVCLFIFIFLKYASYEVKDCSSNYYIQIEKMDSLKRKGEIVDVFK